MLSLPLIVPHDDLLYTSSHRNPNAHPANHPSHDHLNNGALTHQQQHLNRRATLPPHGPRHSPLQSLVQDENAIEHRKQNVRRFGAAWLRPPGVLKTYQARMDEELERQEQMEIARREALMMEMAAAAEQQQGQQGAEGEAEGEEMEGMEEVDLDAEVPEAEEDDDDDEDDEDEDGEEDEEAELTQDVTFNEESLLEGSIDGEGARVLELEDAELVGRLQDERDLGMIGERDLDDDVPEAGSYEHTDTEVEDESIEEDEEGEEEASVGQPSFSASTSAAAGRRSFGRSDGRLRTSLISEDSELIGGSSFVGSSPAMGRGNAFRNRVVRRGRGS